MLRKEILKMQNKDNIKLVIIDPVHLMIDKVSRKGGSHKQAFANIIEGIRDIAHELDLPIIVTSQVRRRVERRHGHRAKLKDLCGSGTLEQIADVVLFILRDDYYTSKASFGHTTVFILKNRYGSEGSVHFRFIRDMLRFESLCE